MYINDSKIAILLAVYNGELFLSEQIDSIIRQTNKEWTLYIRDDNSSDNTLAIIKDYCTQYDNIIQINDDLGNLGCRYNFFKLLEVVDSDYYMFCDADDVWFPNKVDISFEKMLKLEFDNQNEPILIHTDYTITDEYLNIIERSYFNSVRLNPDYFKTFNQAGILPIAGGASMMFNRKIKSIIYPIVEDSSMYDAWILLNVLKFKGIVYTIKQPTMYYRQHSHNLYGAGNRSISFVDRLRRTMYMNKITARNLKKFGWGGYFKFFVFKFFVLIKRNLLKFAYYES